MLQSILSPHFTGTFFEKLDAHDLYKEFMKILIIFRKVYNLSKKYMSVF